MAAQKKLYMSLTLKWRQNCRLTPNYLMDYDKLLNYTFHLLAKKRYTNLEIRKKCKLYLVKRGGEDDGADGREVIDKVVERLIELKYLDDEQYAKDYINERIKFKPRGIFLIKRELKLKGIVTEVAIDEVKMATELLSKKRDRWQRSVERSDRKPVLRRQKQRFFSEHLEQFNNLRAQKAKAASYLASKGFRPDTVYKAIDRCYNNRESRIY